MVQGILLKIMQTILVTGGTGFIGSHTTLVLLEKGYRVIVVDSQINSSSISLNRVQDILKIEDIPYEKIIFEMGDIRDEKFLKSIFVKALKNRTPIDAVIHFAGLKAVEESVFEPLKYWDNNVMGSLSLFRVMSSFDCKNIVFSSSATIYGNPEEIPVKETCPIKPNNPYGYTKVAIENILNNLFNSDAHTFSRWRVANLRYFNPIGAHSSGLLGEAPNNKPNNLFPYICRVAQGIYEKLIIFGNNWPTIDGTGVRDYIHVMDLAEAHLSAMEFLLENKPQLINLNIGTGVGTSVLELIDKFKLVNKCQIPYEISERRKGDVAKVIADNSKVISSLSWKPKRTIKDMCRDGWNWQLNNPNGYG